MSACPPDLGQKSISNTDGEELMSVCPPDLGQKSISNADGEESGSACPTTSVGFLKKQI